MFARGITTANGPSYVVSMEYETWRGALYLLTLTGMPEYRSTPQSACVDDKKMEENTRESSCDGSISAETHR